MLYRKYKAIAYEDRLRKTPPFDGLETDNMDQLYKYIQDNAKYNLTYEVMCRGEDEKHIIFPEQVNDARELFEILTEIEVNCE